MIKLGQLDTIEKVHLILFTKLYNARCSEFVCNVSKLSCIQENRAVDASVGLRDKLKVYAIHKNSMNNNCHALFCVCTCACISQYTRYYLI